jgi:hypothetical protein
LSLRWFRLREWVSEIRWCVTTAIVNRFATAEMRHAALLLGYDLAMGYGRPGLLSHLREHATGNEVAFGVLYGDADERAAGEETLGMERSLYGTASLRPTRPREAGSAQTALSVLAYHHNARRAGIDTWDILDGILSMCAGVLELRSDPATWFPESGGAG